MDTETTSTATCLSTGRGRCHSWRPPVDVYETEDAVCVRLELAGVDDRNLSVGCVEDRLLLRAFRLDTEAKRGYHRMELAFGELRLEVKLPRCADLVREELRVEFQLGLLFIRIPKKQEASTESVAA